MMQQLKQWLFGQVPSEEERLVPDNREEQPDPRFRRVGYHGGSLKILKSNENDSRTQELALGKEVRLSIWNATKNEVGYRVMPQHDGTLMIMITDQR